MKTNESGRSMIEMLGVLAIIGVLSVGGLAGYAKAMSKYRTNKSIEQITQIVASTRNLFSGHKDYSALGIGNSGSKTCSLEQMNLALISKGHLVPEEMMVKGKDNNGQEAVTALENPFAGDVIMSCGSKRDEDQKAFTIVFKNVPNEACIELATQDWGSGTSAGLVAVCVNGNIANAKIGSNETTECTSSKSMSVLKASAACTNRNKQEKAGMNTISWKFF